MDFTVVVLMAYINVAKSNNKIGIIFNSPLPPPPKASMQAPKKLTKTPSSCFLVVENFQTNEPTIITNIGIIELMIPAILLVICVSAIGKRNIGIKFPETAAIMSYFRCFLGNCFILETAQGISTSPEINTLKAPTSYGLKYSRDFLISINDDPQITDKPIRRIHFRFSVFKVFVVLKS